MPSAGEGLSLEVEGHELKLTNLGKVFYPQVGFTKAQVLQYYTDVAHWMVPHLVDRPLTLKRYPNGVDGEFFYQKEAPANAPDWIPTTPIYSRDKGRNTRHCLANSLASLLWLVNAADLEFHTRLSTIRDLTVPTVVAFDLDPGEGADIHTCAQVALFLRDHLGAIGLEGFPKTSGSKGMQVYVPLNSRTSFDATKDFSRGVAVALQRAAPDLVTANMRKDLRIGKVLVDYSQNSDFKSTVAVYSLRAKSRPTVSTPVTWDETKKAAKDKKADFSFGPDEVRKRIAKHGDLFEPVVKLKQKLPKSG